MTDSTYEAAKRCPKCQEPGKLVQEKLVQSPDARPGTKIHVINCETESCVWYGTSYFVQVNPDGSVPPPRKNQDKLFPMDAYRTPTDDDARLVRETLRGHNEQMTKPGGGETGRRV